MPGSVWRLSEISLKCVGTLRTATAVDTFQRVCLAADEGGTEGSAGTQCWYPVLALSAGTQGWHSVLKLRAGTQGWHSVAVFRAGSTQWWYSVLVLIVPDHWSRGFLANLARREDDFWPGGPPSRLARCPTPLPGPVARPSGWPGGPPLLLARWPVPPACPVAHPSWPGGPPLLARWPAPPPGPVARPSGWSTGLAISGGDTLDDVLMVSVISWQVVGRC